ncbi:Acyl-[acyl-carrier-protein]--UDP-N-acetylglucosamine O-acyltransferase [compost metagenome]
MMIEGNPLAVRGFNLEGLRRRGFTPERLKAVKQMHKLLYRQSLSLEAAQQGIAELLLEIPEAQQDIELMQSFLASSTRGIAR